MTSSPIAMPDPPQTPAMSSRERSDTILTTSSSDSFPHPQTPQTPSILGVLTTQQTIPYKSITVESPTDVLAFGRNRQNSYGLGTTLLSSSPEIQGHSSLVEDPESILPVHTSIPPLEPPIQLNTRSTDIAQQGDPLTDPNRLSISTDGTADISDNAANTNRRSKLKAVVRRKLERSKSSFRSLRKSKEDGVDDDDNALSSPPSLPNLSAHGTAPTQANGSSSMTIPRPRRSRLKSLLSMSRAPSSTSIRSTHVTSAAHRHDHPPITNSHIGHHEITVRDYAHHPLVALPVGARTRHLSVDGVVQLNRIAPLTGMTRRDGIERALELTDEPAIIEEEPQLTHPVRIARPRALSMPLLDTTATALLVEEPEDIAEEERNYFDTVLPRELKVLIMKTLLEVHTAEGGNTRWSGEPGGRRELIKLSRVSEPRNGALLTF